MRRLCCHSLEKGVAEHAIGFCRTMEIADPCIECRGIDDADRERLLPYGFNHPRERFPREAVDQIRCCRVNVDDPRRYGRRVIAGLHEQRIQLSADTGIPAGPPLQLHLTGDRPLRDLGVWMEVGGAVISLEHGDTTTGLEQLFHQPQRCDGMGEVFEHKADECVIERLCVKRQRKQIRVQKLDIRQAGRRDACDRARERCNRMIECDDLRAWTIATETDRLRAGAATDLEHATTGRNPGISMEEAHDRSSLRQQALALALAVPVDVHTRKSSAGMAPASCTLLQPCCPAPRARREAKLPRKHARHVTLVGETGRRRCRREGSAVTNQHPRTLGAAAQQPRVGRQPIGSLEAAQHLIAAQPREPGQVCETRASPRIVSEALADLLEVAGWRIAPPRRAMPRHQAYATCDQRFLECQGIQRSRVWRAIVPALETRKQTLEDPEEHRVFDHGARDLGVPPRPPLGCREGRHHVHIDIHDAPAPRGRAERSAIMDFTGIGGDYLAGVTAHDAAATEPLLGAVFQEPESVGVVPVTAELLRAVDVRAVDACERGSQDTRNVVHVRDERLPGLNHASSVTYRAFAWLATSSLSPTVRPRGGHGTPRDRPDVAASCTSGRIRVMKAAVCAAYGPPEVLQVRDVLRPSPKQREILVKVHATSVTVSDTYGRDGFGFARWWQRFLVRLAFGYRRPRNPILGIVLAGEVEQAGKGVRRFRSGDRVYGLTGMRSGTYAQYMCVKETSAIAESPSNLSDDQATAIPYRGLLALYFLTRAGAHVTAGCGPTHLDLVKTPAAEAGGRHHPETAPTGCPEKTTASCGGR